MEEFYSKKKEEVIKEFNSSADGLSPSEVKKRIERYGYNELIVKKGDSAFKIFLKQFQNFLIILLIFAAIVSVVLGEMIEAIAMGCIILLSVILGFYQEYRAEKAIEALKKISAPEAKVVREGKEIKIPAKELVPGDIILLEEGDIVPADCRLIEAVSMQVNESSLTGESVASRKLIDAIKSGTAISDQSNMIFMSTIISYGKGKGIVVAAGMNTEFGKIAKTIQSVEETSTPLQVKFERMAKQIGIAISVLIAIVFVAGIIRGDLSPIKLLIFALSLAVASIPSALPAIVTVGLSLGAKTLAKKNMIIKKLPAAESLGSATMICSDKTGTITKNQMTVTKIFAENNIFDVSGTGYEPLGKFSMDGKEINSEKIEILARAGYLCNNSQLNEKEGKWDIIGDPTEGSLVVLGKKAGMKDEEINKRFSLVQELPFDSDRKRMTKIFSFTEGKKKKVEAYVKGAPDLLLRNCDRILINGKIKKLTPKDRKKILSVNNSFAESALRVLAFAFKDVSKIKKYSVEAVEKNLVFIGLAGMIDPPRDGVKEAIKKCEEAGIGVMVITGDHALTTKAVAKQIGLFKEGDIILTGEELDKLSDKQLEEKISKIRIIARALPIQKSRIIDALQKKGHIVAMTGDGVNDAPALKKADIGIAMGITGTDVAKEVSKATLADDNFSTIVNAIAEGRNIYDKMLKSTKYLLSCNVGEIITIFFAIMIGLPLPLITLQILLINLLTDGVPAMGLSSEPAENDIMKRSPRNPKENPITLPILITILIFGVVMGIGTLYIFNAHLHGDLSNLKEAQTVAFTTLVMMEMFAVVGSRSLYPFRGLNPFTNMWLSAGVLFSVGVQILIIYLAPLQKVFGTVALGFNDWLGIIAVASLGYVVMELSKIIVIKTKKQTKNSVFYNG